MTSSAKEQKVQDTIRELLATDHVILNHDQVTWTTPELVPPSPNNHTTPSGGRFSSRQIQRASLPYTLVDIYTSQKKTTEKFLIRNLRTRVMATNRCRVQRVMSSRPSATKNPPCIEDDANYFYRGSESDVVWSTAVSVTDHYTGWVTTVDIAPELRCTPHFRCLFDFVQSHCAID
ncbi:hypothetical protein TNCV_694891 [Trichonephila clavipes]|nr:hypothetical protein TNCV_694891 [Trichonephila clavipes]